MSLLANIMIGVGILTTLGLAVVAAAVATAMLPPDDDLEAES